MLSTLWQPRYNSSRTASLCGPLLTMRVDIACVCAVCAMKRVRVYRGLRACALVCWNPTVFSLLFCLLCLLCCSCRIMSSVSHRASRSLLCGSHGITAVAQQVCVDHFCACANFAYACVRCACAMLLTYVACTTSTAVMFKVNIILFNINMFMVCSLSNTAAHALCFLQHKL